LVFLPIGSLLFVLVDQSRLQKTANTSAVLYITSFVKNGPRPSPEVFAFRVSGLNSKTCLRMTAAFLWSAPLSSKSHLHSSTSIGTSLKKIAVERFFYRFSYSYALERL
jgi:hypothetical protein